MQSDSTATIVADGMHIVDAFVPQSIRDIIVIFEGGIRQRQTSYIAYTGVYTMTP